MKHLFRRTKEWNSRMGIKTPEKFKLPIVEERYLAHDLMVEESKELLEAETKQDALDAGADQLFVLFGNMSRYGITYDELKDYMTKVVKSNESKFADTEEQAILSIDSEARRLNISPNDISYKEIDGKYVIFNSVTGKILKSISYICPEEII